MDQDDGYITSGFHKNLTNDPHGICRKVEKEGQITDGMFLNGKLNGYGRVVGLSFYYTGMWKDDVYHGKGKFVQVFGGTLEGTFANGIFTGKQ